MRGGCLSILGRHESPIVFTARTQTNTRDKAGGLGSYTSLNTRTEEESNGCLTCVRHVF